jgi:hypothetical protein
LPINASSKFQLPEVRVTTAAVYEVFEALSNPSERTSVAALKLLPILVWVEVSGALSSSCLEQELKTDKKTTLAIRNGSNFLFIKSDLISLVSLNSFKNVKSGGKYNNIRYK